MLDSSKLNHNARYFAFNRDEPIDLTQVADYVLDDVPLGHFFIVTSVRVVLTNLDGTLTSAPTAKIGNNVALTNVVALAATSLGTTAQYNASVPPALLAAGAGLNNLNTAANANTLVSTTTPIKLSITVGAVLLTATLARARVQLVGFLVPA